MHDCAAVLRADRDFFTALIAKRLDFLESLLGDDFTLVALDGGIVSKSALLEMVGSGQLRFEAIDPLEAHVRFYNGVAVVVGRTQMSLKFGDQPMEIPSRYTHVFDCREDKAILVAAQGTPIQAA